jgi:hypothetical protein
MRIAKLDFSVDGLAVEIFGSGARGGFEMVRDATCCCETGLTEGASNLGASMDG